MGPGGAGGRKQLHGAQERTARSVQFDLRQEEFDDSLRLPFGGGAPDGAASGGLFDRGHQFDGQAQPG